MIYIKKTAPIVKFLPLFIKRRLYPEYVCGACKQLHLRPLKVNYMWNTVYYGPSGCLEMRKKSHIRICSVCRKKAYVQRDIIV